MTECPKPICTSAAALLQHHKVPNRTLDLMRRLTPARQTEVARIMIALNRFSEPLMLCLVATTSRSGLVDSERALFARSLPEDQLAAMEQQSAELERELLSYEQNFGRDQLDLIAARTFIRTLLDRAPIVRYLARNYPEILAEFQTLAPDDHSPVST